MKIYDSIFKILFTRVVKYKSKSFNTFNIISLLTWNISKNKPKDLKMNTFDYSYSKYIVRKWAMKEKEEKL